MPAIPRVSDGQLVETAWGNAVADALNATPNADLTKLARGLVARAAPADTPTSGVTPLIFATVNASLVLDRAYTARVMSTSSYISGGANGDYYEVRVEDGATVLGAVIIPNPAISGGYFPQGLYAWTFRGSSTGLHTITAKLTRITAGGTGTMQVRMNLTITDDGAWV